MNKRKFSKIKSNHNEECESKRRRITSIPSDKESSVFDLPELVEIIISYLFSASKAILAISGLSTRHYNIVHSRAMWVRLGLTPSICDEEHIPASNLLFILHKLRIKHLRSKMEKYSAEIERLNNYGYDDLDLPETSPVPRSSQPDPEFYCEEFYTNTSLTDEACMQLLRMIQKTQAISIRLSEFVEVITCSESQLTERYSSHRDIMLRNVKSLLSDSWICMDLLFYPSYFAPSKILRPLVILNSNNESVEEGDYIKCSLWKSFINEHKSVTFLYSRVLSALEINDALMFVKYNSQTNLIESCGSFEAYAIKTFGNSTKDINKAFNTILELPDDGEDDRWLTEFKNANWKMALVQEDFRRELEASWYKNDEIGQDVKFFRANN